MTHFAKDEFTGLNELYELYLQHNPIKALWPFQRLPLLRHLNITNNHLEAIMSDEVPMMLERIYLLGNTLQCDCRLQSFLIRRNTNNSFVTDTEVCTQPVPITSNCPGMCSCGCTSNGDDHFISVDCSSKSLSIVPQFLRNDFRGLGANETISSDGNSLIVMEQNIYPSFYLEDRVLGVNLENNSLESLEGIQLPPDLIQLFLANNKLRRLPDSIIESQVNLKNVTLSGNPWNCDCDALKFKRWLTSLRHETVQDIENVRCGTNGRRESTLNGRVIRTLTELELCPKDLGLAVTASIGVLAFATLCFATIILYKKYELHVKVFLYYRGLTFVKEKDLDYEKVFDAFLSFCHQDDKFVTEDIISVIEERDPSIHLCIHYRHFMPGEYIYDNIIWAVRSSKRTVLILSKNFLESEWCLMEFRTAHMQTLEDKEHRIIIIKLGDLPKEIDPGIKAYLNSTTYLTWGEKNFWNKLLYVLPTGGRDRQAFQEV